MIKKSRMLVAGGLTVVLATAGIAVAGSTGAQLNDARVVSKVTPNKLSKKKFSKVNVLLGVVNSPDSAGNENANAAAERIAWSKNIKITLNKAPRCTAPIANGTPPAQAKAMCPRKSFLGGGKATVHAPGPVLAAEPVVSVFNGPGRASCGSTRSAKTSVPLRRSWTPESSGRTSRSAGRATVRRSSCRRRR